MMRTVIYLGLLLASAALLAWSAPALAFEFRGFGDVTYAYNTTNFPDAVLDHNNKTGRFAIGTLDLYLAEPIGDRMDVLAEIAIEPDQVFGQTGIDLERIQVGYIFNDLLKIRAGRFHTFLGYWNVTYHHGTLMQTTIERPEFLNFEDHGGVFPVHAVGLWLSGRYKVPRLLIFNYDIMFTNGSRIVNAPVPQTVPPTAPILPAGNLDMNLIGDDKPTKQLTIHLAWTPLVLRDLRIGVFGNKTRVNGYTGGQNDGLFMSVDQQIYGADVEYINQRIEFLSEYYYVLDKDLMGGTGWHNSDLYYVQLGVTLAERFIPYARYEQASLKDRSRSFADQDPYFANQLMVGYKKGIVGMRYNLNSSSALKAEVQFVSPGAGDNYRSYTKYEASWAFAF